VTVKITRQSNNFFLIGPIMSINCSEQLKLYNNNLKYLNMDFKLYKGFSSAHDAASLYPMIDKLAGDYGLRAGAPILRDRKFVQILVQYLTEIHAIPDADINSTDTISKQFYKFARYFSKALKRDEFPEVSLAKLLHFVQPSSFWIIDSRVQTILGNWNYRTDFAGFGSFLKDLFRDPEFGSFRTFLTLSDRELVGSHPMNKMPYPFLKLLDKLLWTP